MTSVANKPSVAVRYDTAKFIGINESIRGTKRVFYRELDGPISSAPYESKAELKSGEDVFAALEQIPANHVSFGGDKVSLAEANLVEQMHDIAITPKKLAKLLDRLDYVMRMPGESKAKDELVESLQNFELTNRKDLDEFLVKAAELGVVAAIDVDDAAADKAWNSVMDGSYDLANIAESELESMTALNAGKLLAEAVDAMDDGNLGLTTLTRALASEIPERITESYDNVQALSKWISAE